LTPHFPAQVQIEAHGKGEFRFAQMVRKGSLLALPGGMYGWDGVDYAQLLEAPVDLAILGMGPTPMRPPKPVREAFEARKLAYEPMETGAAVRTYNVLLAEGRRVAAALIAL
jgi:uncharacterized protein